VVITNQTSQQLSTIGAVRLTTTVCFSQQSGCPSKGNSDTKTTSGGFQVMLGYRVPEATTSPQSFNTVAGQFLAFSRDQSYASELERLLPAGPGQRWVGYRTATLGATPSSPTFTVSPGFSLRQGENGAPFAGPFEYRVVSGARVVPSTPNAAVDCGADPRGNDSSKTTCVDSPAISELSTNLQQPTQDLGIVDDPASGRAARGKLEPVVFRAVYNGKTPAPTFSLRASTDIEGAHAKPRPDNITPVPGTTKIRVNLRVPPDTPRGSYDVTLVATLANGQTRSSTHELHIGQLRSPCGTTHPTISGTPGPDHLLGTRHRDVIVGFGGDDVIRARGGDDVVCAGSGADTVKGGSGNDKIVGREGKDLLVGGRGHDLMIGGPGRDRFRH
jgi:RTX calcium-binding nonapeptide repeat (4 copies)